MKCFSAFSRQCLCSGTNTEEDDVGRRARTTISSLPDDIVTDILTRLPADSVQRCKRVCSLWHRLCTTPKFAEMHLNQGTNNRRIIGPYAICRNGVRMLSIEFTRRNRVRCKRVRLQGLEKTKKLIIKDIYYRVGRFYASCNGLLLFTKASIVGGIDCVISNPVTREEVDFFIAKKQLQGFFFDRSDKEYKLLLYDRSNRDRKHYSVFGLSTKETKQLRSPACNFTSYQEPAVFANGALVWRVTVREKFDVVTITLMAVMVYDLVTQDLQVRPFPGEIIGSASSDSSNTAMQLLETDDGRLCACYVSVKAVQVWTLTQVESWTWERWFTVRFSDYVVKPDHEVPVVLGFMNGDVVVYLVNKGVLCYNPRQKVVNWKYMDWSHRLSNVHAASYTGSFVSLQHCNLLRSSIG